VVANQTVPKQVATVERQSHFTLLGLDKDKSHDSVKWEVIRIVVAIIIKVKRLPMITEMNSLGMLKSLGMVVQIPMLSIHIVHWV